ncbi:MAG TPA: hypothetical protein DCO79_06605 [Spirochaeta sp.]|nr:hypothetical protein [Spirochaeta sp.]
MKSKLLGHSANDLFWFILPLVLPALLARYDLNFTQAGGILTIYLLFTAAGSFVIGRLSDKMSRKLIMSYGFLLSAAGLIASSFAPNLPTFLVLISVTAIGVSTFHPVMYAVIDETYTVNKSRVLGLYECFGTAAILLMFLVNGFLLSRIGVRGVLIVTAVPAVIMGVVYRLSDSINDASPEYLNEGRAARNGKRLERGEAVKFSLFLFSVILRVISVTAVLNFLPTIFVKFFGMPESRAAYATAFFFVGGIAGSLVAGKLSERFNSFGIIMISTVFIGLIMLILSGSFPVWIYLIIIALFGAFASGCIINQNLLMSRLGGALGKGELFGILMGTMTVTTALSPLLFGLVIDYSGYRQALYLFSLPLVVSVVILGWLLKSDHRVNQAVEVSL